MFVDDDNEPLPHNAFVLADNVVMDRYGCEVGRVLQSSADMRRDSVQLLIEVPSPLGASLKFRHLATTSYRHPVHHNSTSRFWLP